jgi:hypothetical protein
MEEKNLVQEVSLPLYQVQGWLKLLGVVMIVEGVISIFTIIGIIWSWVLIWMGILLFKAATSAGVAQLNGEKEQLIQSLRRLKTFFMINGILMLIGLISMVVMLIVSGGALFSLMNQFK